MAGEWVEIRLGDVCTKIGSGATPRGGSGVYLESGEVTLIRSQNVYNDGFRHDGLVYLTEQHANGLSNVELQKSDVLLNITGDSVARACQVDPNVLPARVNQHVAIIRPDPKKLSPLYLRYFLVSPLMQSHMMSLAGAGATRAALTKGMIEGFKVFAPANVREQQAIACILGALDSKIELNRRRNETLEGMARALFQSWFVDFDPVRAKAAGCTPIGLKPELEELFPDSFEDSALGEIPKDWRVGTLESVLSELETGSRPKGGVKDIGSGVPSVGAESIVGIGRFDFAKTKYVPAAFFENMKKGHVRSRDVLLYKDGGKPGLYEPHVSMFGDGFPFTEFAINEHVYRLRSNKHTTQTFLYFWLTTDSAMEEMRVKGTGVAIPGLNSTAVKSLHVLVPSHSISDKFDSLVDPFISQLFSNCKESRTLITLREALLPRLISGELKFADAERIVARAL